MKFSSISILPIIHLYGRVVYLRCAIRLPNHLICFCYQCFFFLFQTCTVVALILELLCYILNCIRIHVYFILVIVLHHFRNVYISFCFSLINSIFVHYFWGFFSSFYSFAFKLSLLSNTILSVSFFFHHLIDYYSHIVHPLAFVMLMSKRYTHILCHIHIIFGA